MFDRLAERFGAGNVFLDIDSIVHGADFVDVLAEKIRFCGVMPVVPGPNWVSMRDENEKMNPTAQKAIAVYGGRQLWSEATRLEAEFSANGLAFTLKRRPHFKRAKIAMEIARPFSRITPIGKNPELAGVLDGPDVYLENAAGEVVRTRKNARQYFPGGRRLFFWDDLDMAYFANYAMWNYLTLPFLLASKDIDWREIEPGLLEAVFPPQTPTHSRPQRFRFDRDTGLLLQHDYTADIISRFATAAHVVEEHAESEGVCFTSKRRVTPRFGKDKPRRGPTLIAIELHKFRLKTSG